MILEITSVAFNENHFGGGESYPWRIFKALSKKTDVLYCVSSSLGKMPEHDGTELIDAHFLNLPPFLNTHNPLPKFAGLKKMKAILTRNDIDIVHLHNLRTVSTALWLFISKLNNRGKYKVILSDHGARLLPFPGLLTRFVDYYAPVSSFSAKVLNSYHKKPTFLIPPIIPAEFFREAQGEKKDIDLLIYGRIAPWKRQDLALKVVEELVKSGNGSIKAVIAGGSVNRDYMDYLSRFVSKRCLSNNVKFCLNVSDEEAKELLARSKLLLALSWTSDMYGHVYRLPELSSATILEAAAMGVPTIASAIEAFREVVADGESGYLVNPENTALIVSKVRELLLNSEETKNLGIIARNLCFANNSEGAVSQKLIDFFDLIRSGKI
jgi:glycosyltransferase involved in cell wall biosynthesis